MSTLAVALTVMLTHGTAAQGSGQSVVVGTNAWADDPPDLQTIVELTQRESELRLVVERYGLDQAAIERRYPVNYSPVRHARLRAFYDGWQTRLRQLDFGGLSQEARVDYVLLRNRITFDQAMLRLDDERWSQMVSLFPFVDRLRLLQETRHDRQRVVPRETAETMDGVAAEVEHLTQELILEGRQAGGVVTRPGFTPAVAARAANHVEHLRRTVADFNTFYNGYDPLYTWWAGVPSERLDAALDGYADAIRTHMVGIRPGELPPIIGDPVLAEGLAAHLAVEMIPYTAEELIDIGWKEFAWIEERFKEVSQDMGFGEDWQAALEHVKTLAPPPGEKPWAIFDIAAYSEDFIGGMDNVTMPPLAMEVWRLAMQTPERQLINPFFTGGEVTRVSYPTDGMTHQDKLMSMRGNTPSFNFATVHHELIPGHHLQAFMSDRFNSHRAQPRTPFWGEGWALYWELLLWDNDFPRSNEDKIGMLFWRLHRAARIVFSLNFQLGNWSAQEAVDFLVDRVGHERANAEAEVRRSAQVVPLYQIAYLVGGLQFYSLYREVVDGGRMTAREFHDAVLLGGRMPVEMVRARITGQALGRDYATQWRFYRDR
jgi:uncharacterized protein (DUF885 family)